MDALAWLGASVWLPCSCVWLAVTVMSAVAPEMRPPAEMSRHRSVTSTPRSVWLRRMRSAVIVRAVQAHPQRIATDRPGLSPPIAKARVRRRSKVRALVADCSRKKAACHGRGFLTVLAVLTVRGFVFEKHTGAVYLHLGLLGGVSSFNSFGSFSSAGCVFEKKQHKCVGFSCLHLTCSLLDSYRYISNF